MRDELVDLAERMALEMRALAKQSIHRQCEQNLKVHSEILDGLRAKIRDTEALLSTQRAAHSSDLVSNDRERRERRERLDELVKEHVATIEVVSREGRSRLVRILDLEEKLEELDCGHSGAGLAGLLLGAIAVGTLWTCSLLF